MGDFASSTITDLRVHMMGNKLDSLVENSSNPLKNAGSSSFAMGRPG